MYQSSISLIQDRVGEELTSGCVVDVYRLASAVRADCPELTHKDVVKAIEWDRRLAYQSPRNAHAGLDR